MIWLIYLSHEVTNTFVARERSSSLADLFQVLMSIEQPKIHKRLPVRIDQVRERNGSMLRLVTLACAGGFIDVAKILISNGANVNLGQSSPLMEASQEGHTELVQYLIQMGADVNQRTLAGDTGESTQEILLSFIHVTLALAYACESGHTEVAEVLLNAGAQVDQAENEGRTPLMKAVRAGHTCTVRYLIGKGRARTREAHSKRD
jgi:hypothetical protein